jgi:hypothetical protein
MGKLKIGNCPRCKQGEVFIDRDQYGWYECCLQCGYTRDLLDIVRVPAADHESAARAVMAIRKSGHHR